MSTRYIGITALLTITNVAYTGLPSLYIFVLIYFGDLEMSGVVSWSVGVGQLMLAILQLSFRPIVIVVDDLAELMPFMIMYRIIVIILSALVIYEWVSLIFGSDYFWLSYIIAMSRASNMMSELSRSLLERKNNYEMIIIQQAIRIFIGLFFISISLFDQSKVAYFLIIDGLIATISTLIFDAVIVFCGTNLTSWMRLRWRRMSSLFKVHGVTIVTFSVGQGCLAAAYPLPRFFVERYSGLEALGVFGALSTVIGIAGMIAGSIVQSGTATLSSYVRAGRQGKFLASAVRYMALALSVGSLAAVILLIGLSMTDKILYEGMTYPEVLLGTTAVAFLSSLGTGSGYVLQMLGGRREIAVLHLLLLVLVMAASAALVPSTGALGGLTALGVLGAGQFLILLKCVHRFLRKPSMAGTTEK
jgi:O-antigen/teichoic acid export membrane protein